MIWQRASYSTNCIRKSFHWGKIWQNKMSGTNRLHKEAAGQIKLWWSITVDWPSNKLLGTECLRTKPFWTRGCIPLIYKECTSFSKIHSRQNKNVRCIPLFQFFSVDLFTLQHRLIYGRGLWTLPHIWNARTYIYIYKFIFIYIFILIIL